VSARTGLRTCLAALALLVAAPAGAGTASLPFVSDDYGAALAEARARGVPLVVDAWAPWCPSCRFMRTSVFTDARLAKLAGRFVWLEVDTEKPVNYPFVARYAIEAWPTLYVIEPAAERVLLRWMGTATAVELERMLGDAERGLRKERQDAAGAALARGFALAADRSHADAARAFSDALAAGGPAWPERLRTVDAMIQALAAAHDEQACAGAAAEILPGLEHGAAFARVAAAGLGCAIGLEVEASRIPAIRAVEPSARVALGLPGVLSDDRIGLYEQLVAARQALGDEPGAKRVAREWLAFVEDESRRSRTPMARSALDGARLAAAQALGEPRRALPALRASALALPGEYFAQSYHAVCALEAGEPKEALEAARRAVKLAEGPRKVRLMVIEAQALQALGDGEAARATVAAAITHGEALPEEVRPDGWLKRARQLGESWRPPEPKPEPEAVPAAPVEPAPAPAPAAPPRPAP
jgi:thioredoxin-like negative regulator of GroEL